MPDRQIAFLSLRLKKTSEQFASASRLAAAEQPDAVKALFYHGRGSDSSDVQATEVATTRRVLSLGLNQSNLVVPLYREIKRCLPEVEFDVMDYHKPGDRAEHGEHDVFRQFHHSSSASRWQLAGGIARACKRADFWWRAWWRFMQKPGLRAVSSELFATARAFAAFRPIYDLYQFHFCVANRLRYLDIVPPQAKVICSFWGSDLLRASGLFEYAHQRRALARADAITVQSLEMREILLSKFGRELFPKVHCVPFPLNEQFYDLIDQTANQPDHIENLRRSLDVPQGRLLVTVGHNGNPANNHLAIIKALARLPASDKSAATWVFPMAYLKKDPSYARACEREAAAAGLEVRVPTRYLDWQELAAFRVATDILIHLPASDALSSTVIETAYAGNSVITGGWLPYGLFRKAKLPLITIDDIEELPSCFSETLLRLHELKREAGETRQRIRQHFFSDAVVQGWVDIYRQLLKL